jgi:hypothetical protein
MSGLLRCGLFGAAAGLVAVAAVPAASAASCGELVKNSAGPRTRLGRSVAMHSTSGKVDRTRPLCSYPKVARYQKSGSTDEAGNFVCATP